MKKQTGFTLIELLAVIVILAIIALIAVPVIMNIISKARKSAFEDTAYGLISAGEMYYASQLLEPTGMIADKEFIITDGKFTEAGSLEVKGSLPTNGKITVTKDGKVAIAVDNGAYCITKMTTESGITTNEKNGDCDYKKVANPLFTTKDTVTAVHICATSGTCDVGTQFAVQVSPIEKEIFRVIKDENNTVTLLMDSNLGSSVAWVSQDDYIVAGGEDLSNDGGACEHGGICSTNEFGPITALKELEDRTKEWTNLPKGYTTTAENTTAKYSPITRSNARARLIRKEEADTIVNSSNSWAYSTSYWTSSANAGTPESAWYVNVSGAVHDYDVYDAVGLRPVIQLSKSNI